MATFIGGINKGRDQQFHRRSGIDSLARVLHEDCSSTRASGIDGDSSGEGSVAEVQGTESEVQREDAAIMQRL